MRRFGIALLATAAIAAVLAGLGYAYTRGWHVERRGVAAIAGVLRPHRAVV